MALLGAPLIGPVAAGAQDVPPTLSAATEAPTTAPATTTTTAVPAPTSTLSAGVGVYSPPRWLPLRRNRPGDEVKVGCTYDSHGSQFGYECAGHHDRWALDFIADPGTPVYAAGAGFATLLTGKPGGSGFGNVVLVDHGYGIFTLYAHLTVAMIPPEGKWVDATTFLGTVGQTGAASAPHLHFEEFKGSPGSSAHESIDPGPLFACRGAFLVSYPQVAGFPSWQGLPWGALTVASAGDACIAHQPAPAAPATPVPSTTTPSTTAPGGTADDDANPWTHLLDPVIDSVDSFTTKVRQLS
ncbi:M23 family metallopeptidase [Aquihabitans sp. McL0605]|uniref:M23 family metallopeptidase n=1 Tax=Aquihabitans sp. McL0605 TaxID=3415671 RepID=UPI003CF1343C